MEKNKGMQDDEFRVLGTGPSISPGHQVDGKQVRKRGAWVALAIIVLLGLGMIVFWPDKKPQEEMGMFEFREESESFQPLDTLSTASPCVVQVDTLVSDRLLTLFIPHRASPRLAVGYLEEEADQKAVMCFQAGDIRADNKEILGDFVLAGEQLATGTSKRGFCAIIDGIPTVGVSDNTPLLSEAVAGKGYFFRQYPLVDKGEPVTNKPQNQTIRKALCTWNGQVLVAVSADKLTLDEFAQTLANLGVDQAIYLVGSSFAYGWSVDKDGVRAEFGSKDLRPEYRNQSFILWE